MHFDEYLWDKKIDAEQFKKSEEERYLEFKTLFDQIHPDSFTQQKLFLINSIRRNYKYINEQEIKKVEPKKTVRPKLKPLKPKTS